MLECFVNNEWHSIIGIGCNGKVGQLVIYYGNYTDSNNPLSQYDNPSIFTIVEKIEGEQGYYILRDAKGACIKIQDKFRGANEISLYDAQEYLTFKAMQEKEYRSNKENEIEKLSDHVKLLKGILIEQGTRIVTETQAKELRL